MTDLTKDSTPAQVRAAWIEDLRSGNFAQTTGRLYRPAGASSPPGYCCLGVLCERAVAAGLVTRHNGGYVFVDGFHQSDLVLPRSVREWAGLRESDGALVQPIDYYDDDRLLSAVSLAELNDGARYSFAQIADVIERGKVRTDGR